MYFYIYISSLSLVNKNFININNNIKIKKMSDFKILIIDDDTDLISGVEAILESQDYKVFSALNKTEGFAKIKETNPDLIILDVQMTTEKEGFEMKKELMDTEYKDIPVLMQTGIEVMHTNWNVIDMVREMRKDPTHKDKKVLLVKSADGSAGIDYLSDDGQSTWVPVSGFLGKPADPEELISEVSRLLK